MINWESTIWNWILRICWIISFLPLGFGDLRDKGNELEWIERKRLINVIKTVNRLTHKLQNENRGKSKGLWGNDVMFNQCFSTCKYVVNFLIAQSCMQNEGIWGNLEKNFRKFPIKIYSSGTRSFQFFFNLPQVKKGWKALFQKKNWDLYPGRCVSIQTLLNSVTI